VPHRKNKRQILIRFSEALGRALEPPAISALTPTKLSDAFNLRANGTTVITRQTASKWLNGETLPDHGHMAVLVSWLNLDLNQIYNLNDLGQDDQ
jgi:hypothetical protein